MPKRRDTIPPTEMERLIQACRRGRVVEFQDLNDIAARTADRVDYVRRIFAKGASIRVGDLVVSPDQADVLILGMESRRRRMSDAVAEKMGAHNRVPDEDRAEALPFWLDANLSIKQLEQFTGRSISTLRRWFEADYPRPDKRGRPRKRKG